MRIHVWGTDFRRGSAEMRRRLYFAPEDRLAKLRELMALGFTDLVYLCTCNRIEFYTTAKDHFCDTRRLWLQVLEGVGLPQESFYEGYQLEGKSAVRHLMRVAASLESLVIGEPQILGQLKDALQWSKDNGFPVHSSLGRSFQLAFETAKRVRTETAIASKPVSVATLGLQHLEHHEMQSPLKQAVVVGRSPISLIVLQWLSKNRPEIPRLWVNRNPDALKEFSESEGATLMQLSDFLNDPPEFSHLFTATSSREPIFTDTFFEKLSTEPKLVFDFAEPVDVTATSPLFRHIKIIKLEGLKEEALANSQARAQAVHEAEVIVEECLKGFCLQQKEAPLLRDFNAVEPTFLQELANALVAIEGDFPPEMQPKLKRWAESLVKKNLHSSREHLRLVLRTISDGSDDISLPLQVI
jgi:glutamyl-tRNA reductase